MEVLRDTHFKTRMHSSGMRTARSLTVSHSIVACTPSPTMHTLCYAHSPARKPPCQTRPPSPPCMPPATHAPLVNRMTDRRL